MAITAETTLLKPMNKPMKTTTIRMTHVALATVLAALAGAVSAQTYTIKVGGAYIDPRATSTDLTGTLPHGASLSGGAQLEVKPQSTLIFSIERTFTDHWSGE
jgi:outer membrane protein W